MGFASDVREFYESVAVCVVPLLSGTGVSLKTLEALELGRPVIATPTGARGIADAGGLAGLTIAREPGEFADALAGAIEAPRGPIPCALPDPAAFEARFDRLLGRWHKEQARKATPALTCNPVT
jgi:glycosyltransferase involved in cell wall biosynthesis